MKAEPYTLFEMYMMPPFASLPMVACKPLMVTSPGVVSVSISGGRPR